MVDRVGVRVLVDWQQVGRPRHGETDVGRYQRALTASLAACAAPGDDVWALVAWPAAIDALGPGIGHAGIGHGARHRADHRVRQMLGLVHPDLAVFTHIAPPGLPAPSALVMHNALFATHPEWLGPDEGGRTLVRTVRAIAEARVAIAVSEAAKIEVLSVLELPPERIAVVPSAPAAAFRPAPEAAARVAARYGLRRYCVAIGDTGPVGNLTQLAEAVARVGDSGLALVSAQSPPQRRRSITGIRFLGPLGDADRADLLAGATAAAAVSFHDGCGIGALEALACGTPLVVSDRAALGEVAGDAALVVPPTVNAIADGVRAVLEPGVAGRLHRAGPYRAAAYAPERLGAAAWQAVREAVAAGP